MESEKNNADFKEEYDFSPEYHGHGQIQLLGNWVDFRIKSGHNKRPTDFLLQHMPSDILSKGCFETLQLEMPNFFV